MLQVDFMIPVVRHALTNFSKLWIETPDTNNSFGFLHNNLTAGGFNSTSKEQVAGSGSSSSQNGALIIILIVINLFLLGLTRRVCTIPNCQKVWNHITRWLSGNYPIDRGSVPSTGETNSSSVEYSAVQLSDRKIDELW